MQESHSSRLEQKRKQAEAELRMEGEMAKFTAMKTFEASKAEDARKLELEKQRLSIAAPGLKTPIPTQRRKAFGL